MKVKLLLTAITLSCLAIDVLAQVSISGKIVSADTNEPVVGANIRIDQSLSGCTTNGKGEFNINNLPDGKHVLYTACRFRQWAAPARWHARQGNICPCTGWQKPACRP